MIIGNGRLVQEANRLTTDIQRTEHRSSVDPDHRRAVRSLPVVYSTWSASNCLYSVQSRHTRMPIYPLNLELLGTVGVQGPSGRILCAAEFEVHRCISAYDCKDAYT